MGWWDRIYINDKDEGASEDFELKILCNLELSNWEWVLGKVWEV